MKQEIVFSEQMHNECFCQQQVIIVAHSEILHFYSYIFL